MRKRISCIGAALMFLMFASSSLAAECRVLDPELADGQYSGGCSNGLANGYGEVRGQAQYRGDFKDGMKHGRGIKVMPNGDRYDGAFKADYRDGKGTYIWSSKGPWAGDRYEGEYRLDLRNGWGIFQWGSGDRYEGPWENDLRLGLSVMEIRRAKVAHQTETMVKSGSLVCTELKQGIAASQGIVAEILRTNGPAGTLVRLRKIEGGLATYGGSVVKEQDMVSVDLSGWWPCEG